MFGLKKKNLNNNEKRKLRVIIVGCGKVGTRLVEILTTDETNYNAEIVVIDQLSEKVHRLTDTYDVMGIVGNGVTNSVLEEAGIDKADLLIAVTDSDELNLLTCTVARRASHCKAIARVRNPEYGDDIAYLCEKLDIEMVINPEERSAQEIARMLNLPAAESVKSFAHGYADLVRIKLTGECALNGMTLADIGRTYSRKALVCAVERAQEVDIPDGSFVLQEGDILTLIASHYDAVEFVTNIGLDNQPVRNVLIIGGGRSAYYLAKSLLSTGTKVTVIEHSDKRCRELNEYIPGAVIINDDGTNDEVLREVGVDRMDAVVALTGIDEENILLSLQVREMVDVKTVTKINRLNFVKVVDKLGIGSVVYPKEIVSESIAGYVRAFYASMESSNVETLYHICNHRVEIIEFEVKADSELTGVPFKDLKLIPDLLIGGIIRNGHLIIPGGIDEIHVGDSVIIVTKQSGLDNILGIISHEL